MSSQQKKDKVEYDFTKSIVLMQRAMDLYENELRKITHKHNSSKKSERTILVSMRMPLLTEWKRSNTSDDTHIIRFIDKNEMLRDIFHELMGKDELVTKKRLSKEEYEANKF